jgi:putative DNA primase/helicase
MASQLVKTTDAALGKWRGLLSRFGVGAEYLTGKHCACPICGNGKDKFRFDDKDGRGTYICNDCGAGDGFKFLKLLFGWDFKTAAKNVDEALGVVKPSKVVRFDDPEKRRRKLNKLEERLIPLGSDNPITAYLRNRSIAGSTINRVSNQLGWIPNYDYWRDGRREGRYDAMAAMVRNNGKPVTFHMTYVRAGMKAKVANPRKILPPISTITGGAVELFEHTGVLGVAEGIETALSCTELFDIPTWAVLNANSLNSFVTPDDVAELYIFGDNDSNYVGQEAANGLARRATLLGITTHVRIPDDSSSDWNDFLVERQRIKNSQ